MDYLSDLELARRFAVARVTIWRWSSQGILPKPAKVGPNCSRWRAEEIEAAEARWLVEREKRFGKPPSEDDWVGETPFDEEPAPGARAKAKVTRRVAPKGTQRPQQAEG